MFLTHVLPRGFMKTRYYGFLGSASANKLKAVRMILLTSRSQPPQDDAIAAFEISKCHKCGGKIIFHSTFRSIFGRAPPMDKILGKAS